MFSTLDMSGKWLVQHLPVLQVVWLRFVGHVIITTVVFAPSMGRRLWAVKQPRLQIVRGLMLGCMTALNFWALQYLQLAETGAIQFSVPILIAVLSAWWLGEHLDIRRWLAILVGFAGVLIIMRPGTQAFHPALLLSVLNALMYASFNIMTRHLARSEDPIVMQLSSAALAALLLTPFALWQWQTPSDGVSWLVIALTGLCGAVGNIGVAMAHRYASAAVLGPFLYQQIIYMIFWGYVVFGQVPDQAVLLGGFVVVSSGLYLLWREFKSP